MADEPCRVLVVDDNIDAADSTAWLLRAWGHRAKVAYRPDHALSVAEEFRPDIVLLDLGLPGMDGYRVGQELRNRLPATKVVVVTGAGSQEEVFRSKSMGFRYHLLKPVDPAALERIVNEECEEVRTAG